MIQFQNNKQENGSKKNILFYVLVIGYCNLRFICNLVLVFYYLSVLRYWVLHRMR
jgi:hypothetical protein